MGVQQVAGDVDDDRHRSHVERGGHDPDLA